MKVVMSTVVGSLILGALLIAGGPVASAVESDIESGGPGAESLLKSQDWGLFPTVKNNSAGNHVMLMQAVINPYGYYAHGLPHTVASCPQTYSGNVDGWFGQCTAGAVRNFRYGHGFSNRGDVTSTVWRRIQGDYQHAHETLGECRAETAPNYTYDCYLRDIYGNHHPRPYSQRVHWDNYQERWLFYHITRVCWHQVRTDGPFHCL